MTGRQPKEDWQGGLATLFAAVVVMLLSAIPSMAAGGGLSDRRNLQPDQAAVGDPALGSDLARGRDVLALDENRRGTLRERIRTRREERINERSRDNETAAVQEFSSRSAGRRINPERVQSWIAQLRERIREEVSDLTGNRLPQTSPGPSAMPLLPDPRATGPFFQPVNPVPLPGASPAAPGIVTDPGRAQSSTPQDLAMPGPELVQPQLARPDAPNAKPGDFNLPSNDLQTTETHEPGTDTSQMSLPPQEDATGAESSSQGQQPSNATGLGGLFSQFSKMLGTAGSKDPQTPKLTGEQTDATNASPTQQGGNPAPSAASSQSPSSVRKTLGEIRKEILMKQNQRPTGR